MAVANRRSSSAPRRPAAAKPATEPTPADDAGETTPADVEVRIRETALVDRVRDTDGFTLERGDVVAVDPGRAERLLAKRDAHRQRIVERR